MPFVRDTVLRAIHVINLRNYHILDFKPLLLSLALHPECDAISSVGGRNWQKRWDLFRKLDLNPVANLCEDILPTDGGNFRYRQLEMIWTAFCIKDPVVPSPKIGGRIQELVDNRNAIAHGDSTPLEVGSRVTTADLYIKYADISRYCSYFLDVIETHVSAKAFLR
jgi:hypothetical protein